MWERTPERTSVPVTTITVRLNVWVEVAELLSVTVAGKEYVPATVGVPVITPAVESVRPDGRLLPDVRDHNYGVTPPVALKPVNKPTRLPLAGAEKLS